MPLLDIVKTMRRQGLVDSEIAQRLREQGYSPLDINQALEQAKIKAAISQDEELMQQQTQPLSTRAEPAIQPIEETTSGEMQPSMLSQEQMQEPIPQQTQETEIETPEYIYPTPQAYYQEYQPYQPYAETAETTTEIAEQIAEEKISRLKRDIGNIQELKETTERRIKNINERLKRIEEIIDKLQATILGKIGSYGQATEDIKKEISLMQESFSKALPTIAKKTIHKQKTIKKRAKKSSKRKAGIEHYLKR